MDFTWQGHPGIPKATQVYFAIYLYFFYLSKSSSLTAGQSPESYFENSVTASRLPRVLPLRVSLYIQKVASVKALSQICAVHLLKPVITDFFWATWGHYKHATNKLSRSVLLFWKFE